MVDDRRGVDGAELDAVAAARNQGYNNTLLPKPPPLPRRAGGPLEERDEERARRVL